jgi:hypothetical protein
LIFSIYIDKYVHTRDLLSKITSNSLLLLLLPSIIIIKYKVHIIPICLNEFLSLEKKNASLDDEIIIIGCLNNYTFVQSNAPNFLSKHYPIKINSNKILHNWTFHATMLYTRWVKLHFHALWVLYYLIGGLWTKKKCIEFILKIQLSNPISIWYVYQQF